MTTNTPLPPAGWYPDPQGGSGHRWWDGTAWTTYTHPAQDAAPVAPAQPVAPVAPGAYVPAAPAAYTTPGYAAAAAPPTGAWRSPVDDRPQVAGMGSALRTVFAKYVGFEGRAGRPEFWWWALFNGIVVIALYVLIVVTAIILGLSSSGDGDLSAPAAAMFGLVYVVLILWALAVLLPNLAVTVRRLRDAGFPWALVFLELIPFGGIAILVMCAQPSKYP